MPLNSVVLQENTCAAWLQDNNLVAQTSRELTTSKRWEVLAVFSGTIYYRVCMVENLYAKQTTSHCKSNIKRV